MIYPTNIYVIVQYYNDISTERQHEIDYCFQKNLSHKHIFQVINMCEPQTVVPQSIIEHEKFVNVPCKERMTFKMAIDYANEHLRGKLCCICNSDTFLDHGSNWSTLPYVLNSKIVLALSRHEFDVDGLFSKDPALDRLAHANTQDAWVFKPPLHIQNHDFCLGAIGCDNAIADRIYKSNVLPVNDCNRFKIIHYDLCRNKTIENYAEFHKHNDQSKINVKPELQGYRFLPDMDRFKTVDDVCTFFSMSAYEKYDAICNIFNSKMVLKNKY